MERLRMTDGEGADGAARPRDAFENAPGPSAHEHLGELLRRMADEVRARAERVVASQSALRRGSRGAGPKGKAGEPGDGERERPSAEEAEKADAESAVHDYRVAIRRLRTLLRTARKLYGERRVRRVEAGLKAYADATGALRDEEVLSETLADLDLEGPLRPEVDAWSERRGRKEQAMRQAVVARLLAEAREARGEGRGPGDRRRLRGVLGSLEKLLARRPKKKRRKVQGAPAQALGLEAIARAHRGVAARGTPEPSDAEALHALRIRYKRLRYAAEAFGPVLGEDAKRIAKSAEKMQKRLGHVHDLDVAKLRMARAFGLPQASRAAIRQSLDEARARSVRKALRDHAEELEQATAALERLARTSEAASLAASAASAASEAPEGTGETSAKADGSAPTEA